MSEVNPYRVFFVLTVLLWGSLFLSAKEALVVQEEFQQDIKPLLSKYCFDCHGSEKAKAGIRVDYLDGSLPDKEVRHWQIIRKQLSEDEMPPEDELQPSQDERDSLLNWIDQALEMARKRVRPKNGIIRRLTVAQYRNTIRDLLGIKEDLTGVLPPDAVSIDGFLNNEQTMLLSPLLIEAYFDIAERALDLAIINVNDTPVIQNFRMDFGRSINKDPLPDKLIQYISRLIDSANSQTSAIKGLEGRNFDNTSSKIMFDKAVEMDSYKQLQDLIAGEVQGIDFDTLGTEGNLKSTIDKVGFSKEYADWLYNYRPAIGGVNVGAGENILRVILKGGHVPTKGDVGAEGIEIELKATQTKSSGFRMRGQSGYGSGYDVSLKVFIIYKSVN